ncbi:hypothetical protein BbINS_04717 [Bartonella bacilliformis INS]|uniref:Uncharacterized protein n=2 Tax=Bartonella bacilliformis TaxID=774 RepID=A1UTH9_BARBK|nr:hypothetical protein BARBAKC583_1004 [Bartonella bacilliformis KC583]EKS43539.1 hypothetical protein BbINS_04717 [Bartonella bacilliformis INS]
MLKYRTRNFQTFLKLLLISQNKAPLKKNPEHNEKAKTLLNALKKKCLT